MKEHIHRPTVNLNPTLLNIRIKNIEVLSTMFTL